MEGYEPLLALMKLVLEEQGGHAVAMASSGEAGLEIAAVWRPDVALIDAELPREVGYAACRRLTEAAEGGTPVLMLCSHPAPGVRVRAQEAGARLVMSKPFTVEQLLTGVARMLAETGLAGGRRGMGKGVAAC